MIKKILFLNFYYIKGLFNFFFPSKTSSVHYDQSKQTFKVRPYAMVKFYNLSCISFAANPRYSEHMYHR